MLGWYWHLWCYNLPLFNESFIDDTKIQISIVIFLYENMTYSSALDIFGRLQLCSASGNSLRGFINSKPADKFEPPPPWLNRMRSMKFLNIRLVWRKRVDCHKNERSGIKKWGDCVLVWFRIWSYCSSKKEILINCVGQSWLY